MKSKIRQAGAKIIMALLSTCAMALTASCASDQLAPAATVRSAALQQGAHEPNLNGTRIWYRVAGGWDGRSAPVVYLAGGPGGNSYSFEKMGGPQLEPENLIVYYDQRGTGRSARPASGDYAISTLVEDIEALRVHLGVPRISLLAHSFGVVLALEYAAKYPDRVEAAVLAGPLWNAPSSCNEHVERLAELRPDAYRTIMARPPAAEKDACRRNDGIFSGREREEITAANMFPNPATRELLQRLENESGLKNTGELGRAVFGQGLTRYKFEGADQVAAPVLVIGGSRDFGAGPRTQRELARLLPRGRFVEYEGIGHWMFLEEPDRFARDVTKFFDTASRQRR